MRSLPRTVFVVFILLCITQAVYYYPLLPERVASHFGVSGRPDAWSDKESFIKFYLITVAFVAVLFPGMRSLLGRIPVSLISLPNREHRLSPERRQETLDVLSSQFFWFGSAILLLLLDMFHQSMRVHLGKAPALEHPVFSIAAYIGFSVFWCIRRAARFIRRA